MKLLSVRFLLALILVCYGIQLCGEITLTYKTAEGPLEIEGFDDKKPYTLENGKQRHLPTDGIFNMNASYQDLAQHAYFPSIFWRKRDFSDQSKEGTSGKQSRTPKTETRYYVGKAPGNPHSQYYPREPLFSEYAAIWGDQIPEKLIFVFVWINRDYTVRHTDLLIAAKGDLDHKNMYARNVVSVEKLYPAVLIMKPDGTFVKANGLLSEFPYWNEACLSLINDDTAKFTALLEKDSGLLQGSVLSAGLVHLAAAYGSSQCMDILLKSGADPDAEMNFGFEAIQIAAWADESEVIGPLLDNGASVSAKDAAGDTALHLAAAFGHLDVCKALLDGGINVNAKNKRRETAVFMAGNNDQAAAIMLLSEHGGNFAFNKKNRQILLIRAIKRNEFDTVEFLLSKKAKADQPINGAYPISFAAEYASGTIIRLLIEHGADPNQTNSMGASALMLASASNYDGVVALVENGADVSYATKDGVTALHMAILKYQVETTQYLLDHGADPNVKNPNGTPLMWLATEIGNRIGLNALIDAGAICEIDQQKALPMMEFAFRYDIPEIVEITLSQCLSPDFRFREVFPAYWVADRYGLQTIKDLLIRYGFDPSTVVEPEFADARLVKDQIRLVKKRDAVYPPELQDKYGEFVVNVEGIVDLDGSFIFPKMVENPVPEMERSILESFTHWKFKPLALDGEPVRIRLIVPMKYVPMRQEEKVYQVQAVQTQPQLVKSVAPNYPKTMRNQKVTGTVVLLFVVDENGNITDIRVESATHKDFIQPAIEALVQWQFSPGYYDGEPVKVEIRLPMQFNLQ